MRDVDPVNSGIELPEPPKGRTATFQPSRRWTYYNRLQGINVGYIVPVYSLREIGQRYGLSENTQKYFRNHILPEPFDIVRRRSVHAHHWSRFVLMVLDEVLKDLEARGYNQFLKSYEDHVDLVHTGIEYLQDHYERVADDEEVSRSDQFGVSWF